MLNKKELPEKTNYVLPKVSRVEVIDHSPNSKDIGRVFAKIDCNNVMIQYQDDGKTLKIFIS